MVHPIPTLSIIIGIASVVKKLCDYASKVKEAQADIFLLCTQLTALKNTLNAYSRILARNHPAGIDSSCNPEFQKMLLLTRELLNELSAMVTPQTGTRRAFQSLTWPFRCDGINDKFVRLERLKSWFIMDLALETGRNLNVRRRRNAKQVKLASTHRNRRIANATKQGSSKPTKSFNRVVGRPKPIATATTTAHPQPSRSRPINRRPLLVMRNSFELAMSSVQPAMDTLLNSTAMKSHHGKSGPAWIDAMHSWPPINAMS